MPPRTRSSETAETSPGQPSSQGAPSTARNAGAHERNPTGAAPLAPPNPASPRGHSETRSISRNMVLTGVEQNHTFGILRVIVEYLTSKGVTTLPATVRELFPSPWVIGKTSIPVRWVANDFTRLADVLPDVKAWNANGEEIHWLAPGSDWSGVARISAAWDPPVKIAAGILSDVKDAEISSDMVLSVAQRSPQALEQLKKSGKEFKDHFQRLLDPVALRRSPEFVAVAQRYKAQLRSLIDEQQRAIVAARKATAAVNKCLGERDDALSRLDPGYVAKRATAAAALREFGIDLEGDTEMADAEGVAQDALANLDF
ncbi:33 kDa protein [Penicillium janczewskii Beauveria bassiana-like virus 1]|uniref:33 kDa protein n=1 Tax=Penicillium janczewskii Beauveria bassiana-like virus 1 TaxID=1755782 RepID=A0A0S2KP92_9VIRU|nr:33 kDa protein [Penicillium janczewskii Beauveria bassiana-like virus 1]